MARFGLGLRDRVYDVQRRAAIAMYRFRLGRANGTPLTNIVEISAKREHWLALASDGMVWAWGANAYGQLETARLTIPMHMPFRFVPAAGFR